MSRMPMERSQHFSGQAKVQIPPRTVTTATRLIPRRASALAMTDEEPLVVPAFVVPVAPGALIDGADDGVKMAPGFAMQELAAALEPTDDGAKLLTVPLPPKLQASLFRCWDS